MSDTTDRSARRLLVISGIIILVEVYDVPLEDLSLLGVKLPTELFSIVGILLLATGSYSLIVNWAFDLLAFRVWYSERDIWSDGFGTRIVVDGSFYRCGVQLLLRLFALEKNLGWPLEYSQMSKEIRSEFKDFKTNVELYTARLEAAGTRFRTLSYFAQF